MLIQSNSFKITKCWRAFLICAFIFQLTDSESRPPAKHKHKHKLSSVYVRCPKVTRPYIWELFNSFILAQIKRVNFSSKLKSRSCYVLQRVVRWNYWCTKAPSLTFRTHTKHTCTLESSRKGATCVCCPLAYICWSLSVLFRFSTWTRISRCRSA